MNTTLYKSPTIFIYIILILLNLTSCKDKTQDPAPFEIGTVRDIDNNEYKTVKIGNQWWMAEDLRVTKYRNGNAIIKVALENQSAVDSLVWATDSTGVYCNNLDNANKIIGKFYNSFAVNNNNNLAPEGWHIATDTDWQQLEKTLGMSATEAEKTGWRGNKEGDKLKTEGELNWTRFGDIWGTNESGFSAIAFGCRLFNSELGDPGFFATGYWWTATKNNSDNAWYRNLDYKNSKVFRSNCSRNYGFGVRCVKD